MSPFFPIRANDLGFGPIFVGYVIEIMAFFQIASSYVTGKVLSKYKIPRYKAIMLGIVLVVACNGSLGILAFVDDNYFFEIVAFGAQTTGGIGMGMITTGAMATVSSLKGSERDQTLGYIEACSGLGLLVGPMTGGFLYYLGGFCLPFFFFAGFYIITYPLVLYILYTADKEARELDMDSAEKKSLSELGKSEFQLAVFISKPRFFFGLLSQMFLLMSLQYLAPNIATHLSGFGFPPEVIGVALGSPAILYASTCPFVHLLTARWRKRGIIIVGYVFVAVGMLMVGGSRILPGVSEKLSQFVFLGMCVIGAAAGLISIPILPEMMEVYEEDAKLRE